MGLVKSWIKFWQDVVEPRANKTRGREGQGRERGREKERGRQESFERGRQQGRGGGGKKDVKEFKTEQSV